MKPKFMITTAIPYANGAPHLGHAYERIVCDAIARFKRADGQDVFFVTGMDEHGLKVQQTANKLGISPQNFVDSIAEQFVAMGAEVNAPVDDVVRTTEPRHAKAVQEIWERMARKGDIYLSKYAGFYSVRDEAYFDEAELTTQESGQKFAPSGAPVEWMEEESYFFRLSAYQEKLLKLYNDQPSFITPASYRNEISAFVARGLNDLSISRTTFDWGVRVPGDPKHVMYVWVDALTNYITATGFPDTENSRAEFWPCDAHVIGKDITRFHGIYWPAFLMSADLPLPRQIVVHGFLLNRGDKMSKSTGNVVSHKDLAEKYGLDPTRYFLLREVSFGQDGSYSHELMKQRINADLANGLGNLAQRSLSMIAKNYGQRQPDYGEIQEADREILETAYALPEKCRAAMRDFALHQWLGEVWRAQADADRYFDAQKPWSLVKTDPSRAASILAVTAEVVRVLAIMAAPAMPEAMSKLLDFLGQPPDARDFAHVAPAYKIAPGTNFPQPHGLFPRVLDAEDAVKATKVKPPKEKPRKEGA